MSQSGKAAKRDKQLNVLVSAELFRRVNMAAAGADMNLGDWVNDVLDHRTKKIKEPAARIYAVENRYRQM